MEINHESDRPTVDEALQMLTPSTMETLDSLLDTPVKIARKTLALMPLGSRLSMEELGIVTRDIELGYDISPFGFDVMLAIRDCQPETDA